MRVVSLSLASNVATNTTSVRPSVGRWSSSSPFAPSASERTLQCSFARSLASYAYVFSLCFCQKRTSSLVRSFVRSFRHIRSSHSGCTDDDEAKTGRLSLRRRALFGLLRALQAIPTESPSLYNSPATPSPASSLSASAPSLSFPFTRSRRPPSALSSPVGVSERMTTVCLSFRSLSLSPLAHRVRVVRQRLAS